MLAAPVFPAVYAHMGSQVPGVRGHPVSRDPSLSLLVAQQVKVAPATVEEESLPVLSQQTWGSIPLPDGTANSLEKIANAYPTSSFLDNGISFGFAAEVLLCFSGTLTLGKSFPCSEP